MRDAFGADSESTLNSCFAVTFGGLETSSSVLANMVRLLAANPAALDKVGRCLLVVSAKAQHVQRSNSSYVVPAELVAVTLMTIVAASS